MPRRLPAPRRRRTSVRAGAAALAAALLVPLAGCSGDDEKKPSGDEGTPAAQAAPGVRTDARPGTVVGILPTASRTRVADQVAEVIDGWWDTAYVGGEFPRTSFTGAFAGFTPRAASRARADQNLLSNAGIGGRLTGVEAVTRRVLVDVLSVKQRPYAATARVTLLMRLEGEGLDRRDRITGRVLLTRGKAGWRVFGYDLRREMVK